MNAETFYKIICPFCGYEMPIYISKETVCRGLLARCKGRNCRKIFEIRTRAK